MAEPLRYTIDHIDRMIRVNQQRKEDMRKRGKLDEFNRPVPPPPAVKGKAPTPVTHEAYCLKCKSKKQVETSEVHETPKGAGRAVGKCPDCGSVTHSFKKAEEAKSLKGAMASAKATYSYAI